MKVLMVCLGNICRSPLAEGILQSKVDRLQLDWEIDSCGTSGFHNGELPDSRSIEVAHNHQIDITNQRSRKLKAQDLAEFDLILAMDTSNYADIIKLAKNEEQRSKVHLILNFLYPEQNRAVPDPYYEGGFESVFEMINQACDQIVAKYS